MGSAGAKSMDEWKPLDIETTLQPTDEHPAPSLDGLSVDAAMLQSQFEGSSPHLDEVRQRHEELLVTAGTLPETGLAAQHPERALAWVVNSINGRINPDGLTIPLHGATLEDLELKTKPTQEGTLVQLNVADGELPKLTREFPLPADASLSLQASFVEGQLHLRW